MTIDELIQDLEYFRNEYGNLDVKVAVAGSPIVEAEEVYVYYEDTYPSYVILTP